MELIYVVTVGWLAGWSITLGIMLEVYHLANIWTRITTLFGVLVVAKTLSLLL